MPARTRPPGALIMERGFDGLSLTIPHAPLGDPFASRGLLIFGRLPPRCIRLVRKWVSESQPELLRNWDLAVEGRTLFPIEPLR